MFSKHAIQVFKIQWGLNSGYPLGTPVDNTNAKQYRQLIKAG